MSAQQRSQERRVDSDGVVRIEQPRERGIGWVLGMGIALTCMFLALSAWLVFDKPEVESAPVISRTEPPPPTETPAPTPASRPAVVPARPAPKAALPKHLQQQVAAVPDEVLAQLPEGLYEMPKPGEEPTGMMLFPAPGTDPVKKGIVVPEDFELPPGYVRHYQTTDDGERLPAILMVNPDHPPVDANGQPIPFPENGIVPPELAPAGLPIQMLDPEHQGEAEQTP